MDLASETAKYVFPKRFESRNLEEALMAVPDLETVRFKVLSRTDQYEIREVEPYFIAETTMPGKTGFNFNGASQSFKVLAEYLFGKNISKERMEMTTPVFTSRTQSDGERMEMTTPVISKKDSIKANNLDELFFTDKEVSMETLREKLSSAFPWLFWEDLESKLFAEDRMVEISDFQSLQEAIEKTTGSGSNVPDYMKIFAIGIEKARGKTTGFVHGNIALLVCAAVQEMEHMPLEDLDERMLSMWGAMLKSAREIGFQVDFAEILLKRNLFAYYVRPKLDDKNKVLENRG